jgi:hypothetical protein
VLALLYETVEDDRKTALILSKPCEPIDAAPTAIDRDATSPPALLGPRAPGPLFFVLVRGQGWCGANSSGCAEPCLAAGAAR